MASGYWFNNCSRCLNIAKELDATNTLLKTEFVARKEIRVIKLEEEAISIMARVIFVQLIAQLIGFIITLNVH